MFDFLWSIREEAQSRDAKADAAIARQDATLATKRVGELEMKIDRLALACQALWELSRGRLDVTDAELLGKIEEIDLRDGREDQRMSPRARVCPHCHRNINTRHSICIYCGATVARQHTFQ